MLCIQNDNLNTTAVKDPVPAREIRLFDFSTPEALRKWSTFSDAAIGGQSTAYLEPSTSYPVR